MHKQHGAGNRAGALYSKKGENMKTESIGDYVLLFERVRPSGAVRVAAIPDHGDTIRSQFIGYTKAEILQSMRALINAAKR